MLAIDAAARRIAAVAITAFRRDGAIEWVLVGLLTGAGLTYKYTVGRRLELCLSPSAGLLKSTNATDWSLRSPCIRHGAGWTDRCANPAVAALIGFLLLEQASDLGLVLLGVLAGHSASCWLRYRLGPLDLWPPSSYEYTNGLVLEPLLVLLGSSLWFAITRERQSK